MNASGNLYLDVAFFGYGVGLVLCGFVAGVILAVILSVLNKVKYI